MSTRWNKEAKIALFALLVISALSLGAISMTRGPGPSWNRMEQPIVEPVVDLGEVASRQALGIGSSSRSGRWLFATGFEDGLAEFFQSGATIETAIVHHGAKCVLLATGAGAEDYARIAKYFYPPSGYRHGLEVMINLQARDVVSNGIKISYDPGSGNQNVGLARIYVSGATKKIQYATGTITNMIDGATWVDLISLPELSNNEYFYHHMKLVVDTENNTYEYLIFDGKRYPIDSALAQQTSSGAGEIFLFQVVIQTHEAVLKTSRIDNLIITAE